MESVNNPRRTKYQFCEKFTTEKEGIPIIILDKTNWLGKPIRKSKSYDELAPNEIYEILVQETICPSLNDNKRSIVLAKLIGRFTTLAQQYIDVPNVPTKIGHVIIGMGILFSAHELLFNGFGSEFIAKGGVTVAADLVTKELENNGRMVRMKKMLAYAEILRLQNGMPNTSLNELERFIESNRRAIRYVLNEHKNERL